MDSIRFESLTKVYKLPGFLKSKDITGIRDLTFSIEEGEIFGLLGLNGSGKTTALRLLLGLILPTSGKVLVLGKKAAADPKIRSHVGYLPENVGFPGVLTPRELLQFYARMDTEKFRQADLAKKRIQEVLEVVGLSHAADRRVVTFSKGMVQRLGVAQAILHKPKILVLDEPASGLDPLGIVEMRELFSRLNREFGITILFSSHSIGEVEKVSHRVAIIAGNRLQKVLSRKDWDGDSKKSLEKHFLECVQAAIKEGTITNGSANV